MSSGHKNSLKNYEPVSWNNSSSNDSIDEEERSKKLYKNKEVRKALLSLLETATCPVCLDRLTNSLVCCINGHATCEACHRAGNLTTCSLCREPFTEQKTTTLSKIIEKLPHSCKYPHCEEIIWDVLGHEKFCSYRPTNCRKCEWTGLVKDLYNHIEECHMFGSVDWRIPNESGHFYVYPCLIRNQIFWRETKIDYTNKAFHVKFFCVPKKKTNESFKMLVGLESDKITYIGCIQLSFEPITEDSTENYVCFNTDILESFTDDFGFLKCSFRLSRIKKTGPDA